MQEVELIATLRQRDDFLFLELPQAIIIAFNTLIPEKGIDLPCAAIEPELYVGAHISVIKPEEYTRIAKKRKRVSEVGDQFMFTMGRIVKTEPENWFDVKEVYFIIAKSQQLEKLRRKYGLSRLINGHDFHVTIGIKRR